METTGCSTEFAAAAATPATETATDAARTPWHCKAVVFGGFCILVGIIWDISWHSTIGRDTFWTPAHLCLHLGGALGGFVGGWLVLKTTFFGTEAERGAAVRIWGMRGPIGAWLSIWGALAMLTSAPFDNWWHDAYGLDVEILSPPHSVLSAGIFFVVFGGLIQAVSVQNRAAVAGSRAGRWLFVLAGGVLLCLGSIMLTEKSFPNLQHTGSFYFAAATTYPFYLMMMARAGKVPMPATTMAAIYMMLTCVAVWVLPLFPGTPMLAPIYNPVTRMVPPAFPLLLVVPAVAVDLLMRWLGREGGWLRNAALAVLSGVAFTGLLLVTQWNFSKFLISSAADNWFFAGVRFLPFFAGRGAWWHQFWETEKDPLNAEALAWAFGMAVASAAVGLGLGNWMSRVRR